MLKIATTGRRRQDSFNLLGTDRRTYGQTADGHIDRQTDGHIDCQTDGHMYRQQTDI